MTAPVTVAFDRDDEVARSRYRLLMVLLGGGHGKLVPQLGSSSAKTSAW
jgi:hypothetical protein